MPTCLPQWSCPFPNCIHGLLQCSVAPFATNVDRIGYIDFSLFGCWFMWSKRWWDIFLVLAWLIIQSTLPPMRHIQQHYDLEPPTSNKLGVFGLTLREVQTWIFYILTNSKENMKDHGKCEMHMPLVVWNLWSMHKTLQSLTILNFD
jgi:hypothetical protein